MAYVTPREASVNQGWEKCDDPTGNNQPAWRDYVEAPDGTRSYSGMHKVKHAGNGMKYYVVAGWATDHGQWETGNSAWNSDTNTVNVEHSW